MGSTPFSVLRRSFDTLAATHGGPLLDCMGITGAPRTSLSAADLAAWLPEATAEATDEVWRRLITRTRSGEAAWTVIAAGLALPGLYAARNRMCRGLGADVADLEAEMLSALLAQMRALDLGPRAVCGRLVYAVRKAGQRYRYMHDQQRRRERPHQDARREAALPGARGPVTVLAEAVAGGVLTSQEAELVARTHLERHRLTAVARELGLSYTTARRRRKRACARLAETIQDGKAAASVDADGL
ncbi:hypothetical protein LP52_25275 [Streptomonospora alba]|uniref:Uncharacterized protein n=1 Tax=Streptomonospora alba TaxID=183763 RepID=A0A0C2J4T0_9ACTN|nr:hypothetical protein [Streptomonospora alba]KIH96396.1 hypothetical protein LP52_25275 [Streptomonospora alba]